MHPPEIERVEDFLTDHFGITPAGVRPLKAGTWSTPFAFELGHRQLVVRFSRFDEDFRKDDRASRYRLRALPVPAVLAVGRAFDGYFAVSERHVGDYLEHLSAPALKALLPNLLATLDAIREVDVSATSGFGWWDRNGHGQDQTWREALVAVGVDRPSLRIHGWSERINDTPAAAAALREGYRTLRRLAERQPEARQLVHCDLLNRNVLIRDRSVNAVLDWGSSQYGDFLLDIAWLWFFAPWSDGWAEIDFRLEAERHYREIGFPVPALEDRLRACALSIAIDALAYLAWKGDRHELDATAERTMHVLNA